ncbi:hypothetical protein BMS3Abin03_01750 [bacterium BMS3Abin03]|nr:hypothetical protein BMS3Abin03_01750 [bacterium BMS3Abin03]
MELLIGLGIILLILFIPFKNIFLKGKENIQKINSNNPIPDKHQVHKNHNSHKGHGCCH